VAFLWLYNEIETENTFIRFKTSNMRQ